MVVNADDLGRSPGVNSGIVAAHLEGIVTSTTLMVNYPDSPEGGQLARRHESLGVGLHLAFSGGPACLPAERILSLVGGDGLLARRPEQLRDPLPDELLAEARAQLQRFRDLVGRDPSHLDTHHHAHRLPVVLEAVVELAGELGVPVRNASPDVGRRLAEAGVPTSDRLEESFYGETASVATLGTIFAGLGEGTTELMCHPARADPELAATSTYAEPRVRELACLTDPTIRDACRHAGITLIDYRQLTR